MVLIEVPDRLEVRVTPAPGTAPPLESSTVPISTAVDTCEWPSDPDDVPLRSRSTANAVRAALDFMTSFLRNARAREQNNHYRRLWTIQPSLPRRRIRRGRWRDAEFKILEREHEEMVH